MHVVPIYSISIDVAVSTIFTHNDMSAIAFYTTHVMLILSDLDTPVNGRKFC